MAHSVRVILPFRKGGITFLSQSEFLWTTVECARTAGK